MPDQPRRLRVVFRRSPDPHADRARAEILDLLAHGLASSELAQARAEAEAALGRAFQHEPDPPSEPSPVETLKRRALSGA